MFAIFYYHESKSIHLNEQNEQRYCYFEIQGTIQQGHNKNKVFCLIGNGTNININNALGKINPKAINNPNNAPDAPTTGVL